MRFSRRELCLLLPALLPAGLELEGLAAEDNSLPSGAFPMDKMNLHVANGNAQIRQAMRGKLATGEGIEVHETTLPADASSTPASHHHRHSEMWLVREGTLELMVNDKTYLLGPGAVGFVRSNEEHRIRNGGKTAATYFLVAVGPGAEHQE